MAHARTTILEAFRAALAGLPSIPAVFDHAALPVPFERIPSISIVPASEEREASSHGVGFPTVRKLTVRVICTAKTRQAADSLAAEVEAAAPYDAVDAYYVGADFAEEGRAEGLIFQTRVNFEVLYEASAF